MVKAILLVSVVWCQVPRADAVLPLIPDATVQNHLRSLAMTKRDSEEHLRELVALKKLGRQLPDGLREIARQAAIHDAIHPEKPTLPHVARFLGFDQYALLQVLLPYYDSPDEGVRRLIERLYDRSGRRTSEYPESDPVVRALLDYLQERQNDPPWPIVRSAFQKAPSVSVIWLTRAWISSDAQRAMARDIYWGEHVVRDVVWKASNGFLESSDVTAGEAQLDKLSRSDEWWVRLYVAEMLCRHDDLFPAPEIRQRLKNDPNPLVVESINDRFHHGMTEEQQRESGRMPAAGRAKDSRE